MRAIKHTIAPTGSGKGISYWRSWLGCCRRARLNEENPRDPEMYLTEHGDATVGSMFHILMELYYGRGVHKPFDATRIRYVQDSGKDAGVAEESRLEAERLFRAYRMQFRANSLGETLSVEQHFTSSEKYMRKGSILVPGMQTLVGLPEDEEFTFQLDAASRFTTAQAKKATAERHQKIVKGVYLRDYKTSKSRWKLLEEKHLRDKQFTAYMLGYQQAFPKVEIKGMIIDCIIRTKDVQFLTVVVPFPNKLKIAALRRSMHNAYLNKIESPDEPNDERCYDWNKLCPFLDVQCDQT